MQRRYCSRPGCDQVVVGRRLCRKHYQQAWKDGTFINEPLQPRKRERVVCPPEHKHGDSSTCYIMHQCRCNPCRDAHSAMTKRRVKQKAYGRFDTGWVDAAPIREHMVMLAEYGIGYKRAAQIAGIGITAARTLIWGRQDPGPRNGELQKHVKRETAEKLLAVQPVLANLADGAVVSSMATLRRIQALASNGWSLSKIGDRIDIGPANMAALMAQPFVTVRRHKQVAVLFEELWDQLPPHEEWRDKIAFSRTLKFAKARRWLPPMAWDDIDTDVEPPVQEPEDGAMDEQAIVLALQGERVRLTPLERREAVTRLVAAKLSDGAIAERLRIADRTVLRIRGELSLAAPIGADGQVVA